MAPDHASTRSTETLKGCRVLGLLNNIEMFGLERGNVEVYKSLRRQGAEVVVGVNTIERGGSLKVQIEKLGFETFSLPFGCQWSKQFFMQKPYLVPKNVWQVAQCCRGLAHQVRKRRATHLHIGSPLVYSFVGPYLAWNKSLHMVFRMGDVPPTESPVNYWIWKSGFRRAQHIIANSEFVRRRVLEAIPDPDRKVQLIYNLAPSDEDVEPGPRGLEMPEVDAPKELRVVYVGQISQHKGIHHFIDVALELAAIDARWHFDIVGGSVYTQEVEVGLRTKVAMAKLASQIVFHGSVTDPSSFYREALVTVVPSLFEEPAANVVLEAKRHGVPTIVYPSGGLPELVTDKVTGWVCQQPELTMLRSQILECLQQPKQCWTMRRACYDEYERRFNPRRFDDQWAQVYATERSMSSCTKTSDEP